ncbi:MAG: LysR family transcriptional regulator [Alicyclobacillus sp.]|nr:LysR family transcriptional regulator [Alicyclobacillus sp.]
MDRHLYTFVTVVKHESFTRAAESLHLTQSAVSREMEALEREYGAKLLDRTNKFVRLTRAGEILYFHARRIVDEYERAQTLIHDLANEPVGRLAIGSSYTFGEYMLPYILAGFKQRYPRVTPKITIMNSKRIQVQARERQADVGIVEGTVDTSEMEVRRLATDELVVIVPPGHRLAGIESVGMEELAGETWILREPGSGTRDVTDQAFRTLDFTPASVMEFGSTQVIKEAVRAGLGVALASKFVIQTDLRFRLLHAVRIQGHPIHRDIFCATNVSQFRTKALEQFIEYLFAWEYPG